MNPYNNKSNRFDPQRYHRRSIRLKGYDYTMPGAYFITVCTYQRECLFGEVVDGEMKLNKLGDVVQHAWNDLPNHYPYLVLDQFCIMPNHVHGIFTLIDSPNEFWVGYDSEKKFRHMDGSGIEPTDPRRGGSQTRPYRSNHAEPKRHGLPEIVRAFKSFSSRRINELLDSPGVPTWQRNYYEHIIRNDRELRAIQEYILANPINWSQDQDNPDNILP